ncbi:hypothetical protein BPAE_0070g00130 [Botrytis paeoniae]|uniref:Uncharacterized protein n=1 Tax=Botrytis paeoniae TaxID=278948 RepID=A0A4Z1FUI7_9HELO|nr:hypothetical protein BPAE_0070g00130 [Botrytis paeoniae]
MGILQENQDPFFTSPEVAIHEELASASIRTQCSDLIYIMNSSPNTICHGDPVIYTPSFQSNKAHQGSDVDKSADSDGTAKSSLMVSTEAVDKKGFRERIGKWIEEVEHGGWEDGRIERSGDEEWGVDGGVACGKRKRWGRGMVGDGDNDDEVRGKKSRVGNLRGVSCGLREGHENEIVKDLERKPSREEREP